MLGFHFVTFQDKNLLKLAGLLGPTIKAFDGTFSVPKRSSDRNISVVCLIPITHPLPLKRLITFIQFALYDAENRTCNFRYSKPMYLTLFF